MEFSRQEKWNGFPCPAPGDLPDPEIKPAPLRLLHWQVGSLPSATWEARVCVCVCVYKHTYTTET